MNYILRNMLPNGATAKFNCFCFFFTKKQGKQIHYPVNESAEKNIV